MKKDSKKKRKNKLSSLILLLLLTAVMLSTATYAWFTANKTVQINSIDVNVATSSGLQISTDATNWKTQIANSDITAPVAWSSNLNQFPNQLTPTSTAGAVDGTSGHLNMFSGTVGTDGGGNFTLTSAALTEAKTTTGSFIAFDIFLRTETAGPIYLTTDANVVTKIGSEDKGLKNASRVAFVQQGNADSTTAPETLQALKTGYDGTGVKDTDVKIWEPNADVHTTYGVSAANEYYAKTTTVGPGAATLAYDGVQAAIGTGIKLNEANATANATYFKPVSTVATIATPVAYSNIFTIKAGVTKIRVYMWVEGQDVDCENNASGSDITFHVVLSQNATGG